eukprot:1557723-Ditylum_brightwellii.AAC.1
MDSYFQKVVTKSLNDQISALRQEMMQQFEFIKIQTAHPVAPLLVHISADYIHSDDLTEKPSQTTQAWLNNIH